MNSKRKGKDGELALAAFLRSQGFEARRGQQFSGTPDSPDIVSDFPAHIECKVTQCLQLRKAVAQAERDSKGKPWVIFHRWNRGPWLAIMSAEDACDWATHCAMEPQPTWAKPLQDVTQDPNKGTTP